MPEDEIPPADGSTNSIQYIPPHPPASRQRDPPMFSGTGSQDIDDWLAAFERVSKYNGWNDNHKLNNAVLYLTDLAKTWFLNHESDISTWTLFSSRIIVVRPPGIQKSRRGVKVVQADPSTRGDIHVLHRGSSYFV